MPRQLPPPPPPSPLSLTPDGPLSSSSPSGTDLTRAVSLTGISQLSQESSIQLAQDTNIVEPASSQSCTEEDEGENENSDEPDDSNDEDWSNDGDASVEDDVLTEESEPEDEDENAEDISINMFDVDV
ncbi:hypothetical protein V7S43_009867 [Phytophthora oleae]|uniref:Uncharacterized protein n=1 Tax=Phytophthora oleae TaxID=2107226 RepID=A0ABD3FJT0_9STRA